MKRKISAILVNNPEQSVRDVIRGETFGGYPNVRGIEVADHCRRSIRGYFVWRPV